MTLKPNGTAAMILSNCLKLLSIIYIISAQDSVEAATTNYLSDNTINTNEAQNPSFYSGVPQVYFVPHQKFISSLKDKYVVSQLETQIPIAVSSTEKTLLSSTHKVALDDSKDVTSRVVKPPQGNQVNYPYVYKIAEVSPTSTPVAYLSTSTAGYEGYEEVPKKYHYGYRVSNPHSGTEFGHSEVNDGISARGYYHVLLPDGRLQNVKYWAGPSGYHATITYETHY